MKFGILWTFYVIKMYKFTKIASKNARQRLGYN